MNGTVETADVVTATDDYATRFSGAVGEYFLNVQWQNVRELVDLCRPTSILDVGGGHAQLAIPLARLGYPVTVLGSDESCQRRLTEAITARELQFRAGDLMRLPFADQSFDLVLAFRLLAHVRQWREFVNELTRVARRAVIVDFADRHSINRFAGWGFRAKRLVEGNTRPYRTFSVDEVNSAFQRAGYQVSAIRRQFALPMAVHRAVGISRVSRSIESLVSGIGFTRRWGSPVIVLTERDCTTIETP